MHHGLRAYDTLCLNSNARTIFAACRARPGYYSDCRDTTAGFVIRRTEYARGNALADGPYCSGPVALFHSASHQYANPHRPRPPPQRDDGSEPHAFALSHGRLSESRNARTVVGGPGAFADERPVTKNFRDPGTGTRNYSV